MFIPGRLAGQRVEGEHGKWLSCRDSKGTGNVNPQDGKNLKCRLGRAATWLSGAQPGSRARALSTGLQEAALHMGWQ